MTVDPLIPPAKLDFPHQLTIPPERHSSARICITGWDLILRRKPRTPLIKTTRHLLASIAPAFLFIIAAAHAQTAYNGDFKGGESNVTQADTLSDMFVFDQISILSPHVTTIWGNFLIYQQYVGASLGLKYEIRTGVSNGKGGTLVKSGTVSNLQQTATGRSTQNNAYREVQVLGTVSFDLAPGLYWLGLQNNEETNPPAQWTSFLAKTSGGNTGPAGDPNPPTQNAILDNSAYATGTELGDYIQQGADYSVGVISVPEPASIGLLAFGALTLATFARRRPTV